MVLKERLSKRNLISAFNSSNNKIILIILTKVVALYIRLSAIYICRTSFQRFVSRLFGGDKSLSLQNGLKNLLQVLLEIGETTVRIILIGRLALGGLADWLANLLSNLGGEKS